MKKIDGETYVNKDDFNKAMSKVLAELSDKFKDKEDPTISLMMSMLIAGEFINLECKLFKE